MLDINLFSEWLNLMSELYPDISQMSRIELGRGGEGSIVSQLYEQVVAECSSKPAKW